jgi:peptidoglycan glycosyltransferase
VSRKHHPELNTSATMNGRMTQVYTGLCVGFAGLVVMLTWWQLVEAGDLKQRDSNNQTAYYEQRVERGFITTRDGIRLATRVSRPGENGDKIWSRKYPQGQLAAHVVGYDTRGNSRAGVERDLNDSLTGSTRDLGAVVGLLDGDETAVGDDVTLTLNGRAQRVAERALAGTATRRGAVVAIEPATGRVLVMASAPSFAPQSAITDFEGLQARRNAPLLNRATQATYVPGSTFKLVTAAAALKAGIPKDRTFPAGCYDPQGGGGKIQEFGGSCASAGSFTDALTHSKNADFARLGDELGQAALREQMGKFGFFRKPDVDGLPSAEVRQSGLSGSDGKPLPADQPFDTARTAIGQDKLSVTPLQMAMVAAGIGNGGMVMEPSVIERVQRANGGRIEQRFQPRQLGRAMTAGDAATLNEMMQSVVKDGSGQAARIDGVTIAGKTGTADYGGSNLVWFVAFAPAENPRVAIAVAIEGLAQGQSGGANAAPIAKTVLEELLKGAKS